MSRFQIIERLDKGGMAEVFRGVSESIQGFKKSVAIKRILPNLVKNEKFVAMFLDEARLSLYLQHANIVHVFDIGQSDNTYFLVMEFVDGCNLKKIIEHAQRQGRLLPIQEALYMMVEACKGLSYAHHLENPETGEPLHVVHRDISPPNILVSKQGEVKLVDFGLAKANSQLEQTDQGVVKGKFSYLAPEAAWGHEVDQRADVFAIGIILWELFTGRRLFYGDTDLQTVQMVREARIPSIGALNPKVESELEAIVRKALAREPRDRYQEAADLGDALSQYLFSRQMKVTASDIRRLVRETLDTASRNTAGSGSIVDAVVQAELENVISLVEHEGPPAATAGAQGTPTPPPAGDMIDTSTWASDLGLTDLSGPVFAPPAAAAPPMKAPPPTPKGAGPATGAKPPPIPPPRKK
ncbi:MAG TPA: serine/threonine-protein kinase [Kofleriaceae bacterium]|nr:serine/threonine-protein kinase [Kofleriaceae bacterium]